MAVPPAHSVTSVGWVFTVIGPSTNKEAVDCKLLAGQETPAEATTR